MYTCRVVTGPETAEGFRLAGVRTEAAVTGEEAARCLRDVLADRSCGLLLVDEQLLEDAGEPLLRRLERAALPVVVPLPLERDWWMEERGMEYLLRLIRRSIGYHMRLKP